MPPSDRQFGVLSDIQKSLKYKFNQPSVANDRLNALRRANTSTRQEIQAIKSDNARRARFRQSLLDIQTLCQQLCNLKDRNADLNTIIDTRPTLESLQALECQVSSLNTRPTSQSYQALEPRVKELEEHNASLEQQLDNRPSFQSQQSLLDQIASLQNRPTVMSHQALQQQVAELEGRPTFVLQAEIKFQDDASRLVEFDRRFSDMRRGNAQLEDEVQELKQRLELEATAHQTSTSKLKGEVETLRSSAATDLEQITATRTQIMDLEGKIEELESNTEALVNSRVQVLQFAYAHFGIDAAMVPVDSFDEDLMAGAEGLLDATTNRLADLRLLQAHKQFVAAETIKKLETIHRKESQLVLLLKAARTQDAQDVEKVVTELVNSKQDLQQQLRRSKQQLQDHISQSERALSNAIAKYKTLESAAFETTVEALNEKLEVTTGEYKSLLEQMRRYTLQ